MDFQDLIDRAKHIRKLYSAYEKRNTKVWSKEQILCGLVGDVGDLTKLLQAQEGYRKPPADLSDKIAHELSDCLYSLIILADKYNISLERAFLGTMDYLEAIIKTNQDDHQRSSA